MGTYRVIPKTSLGCGDGELWSLEVWKVLTETLGHTFRWEEQYINTGVTETSSLYRRDGEPEPPWIYLLIDGEKASKRTWASIWTELRNLGVTCRKKERQALKDAIRHHARMMDVAEHERALERLREMYLEKEGFLPPGLQRLMKDEQGT